MFRNGLTSIDRSIPLPASAAFEPLTMVVAVLSLSIGVRNVPVIDFVGTHLPSTATLFGFFGAQTAPACPPPRPWAITVSPPWVTASSTSPRSQASGPPPPPACVSQASWSAGSIRAGDDRAPSRKTMVGARSGSGTTTASWPSGTSSQRTVPRRDASAADAARSSPNTPASSPVTWTASAISTAISRCSCVPRNIRISERCAPMSIRGSINRRSVSSGSIGPAASVLPPSALAASGPAASGPAADGPPNGSNSSDWRWTAGSSSPA